MVDLKRKSLNGDYGELALKILKEFENADDWEGLEGYIGLLEDIFYDTPTDYIGGSICAHCGTREDPTIDHIAPKEMGGSDDLKNLQVLCRSCNSKKGTKRDLYKTGYLKDNTPVLSQKDLDEGIEEFRTQYPVNSIIEHPQFGLSTVLDYRDYDIKLGFDNFSPCWTQLETLL